MAEDRRLDQAKTCQLNDTVWLSVAFLSEPDPD